MAELEGYDEIMDYKMSEKFGLDWKRHDSVRMYEFWQIIGYENERINLENNKTK